jgi:hypothetical protein
MEEFIEALGGGAIWGAGFALAAGLVGGLARGFRPVAKNAIKSGIAASEWLMAAGEDARETLTDIYQEARAERHKTAAKEKETATASK